MTGSSSYEVGGSGTVYLEKRVLDTGEVIHKTLKVDNNGLGYPRAANYDHGDLRDLLNGDYVDISRSGGITWLWHHSDVYIFDEVHIHGKAHVAILTNTSTQEVLVRGGKMFGDRTGVLHVGQQQTFGFDWVDIYIPVNTQVYRYGHLELPRRAVMRDVWMEVNGTLSDIEDFTVESGGLLYFWSYGSTRNKIDGVYQFVNMTIRADGKFELLTVADYNRMVLNLTSLMEVKAGGYVRTNDMLVIAENVTIDVAGDVHADWSGHSASDGPGSGLDKPSYSTGASGGAHGGRGGRWDNGLYSSVAYDSMYTPSQPGSGGGMIHLEVHDTLRVEGRLHANGEDGRHDSDGSGGGGAGGSIMAHVGHLDGSGTVEVNGGEAYLGGGGSGGRIAVYTDWYDFIGELQAYGGTTHHTDFREGYGSSGTVYVQDKSNQDDPIRKLILDNNQVYTEPSRVGELHKIRSAGYGVSSTSTTFTTYAGVVVSTTGSICCSSSNRHPLRNIGSGSGKDVYYSTRASNPVITYEFPFTLYVDHVRLYPQCSYASDYEVWSELGGIRVNLTDGYVDTYGCTVQTDSEDIYGRVDVGRKADKIIINLKALSSRASMNEVEIYIREEPNSTVQDPFTSRLAAMIVAEDENVSHFELEELSVLGWAALGMTQEKSVLTAHGISGDHSGLATIREGQELHTTFSREVMPFSVLVHAGAAVTLPEYLDCKNVELIIRGS
ncbi:uncharacterized protein [Ptychodera flava]|uniref:uncharacterized protein n=1 Tax=Ptychodera flava TaxID=63121 RepID=UPI00396A2E90